jgi:SAM-dependent methyltransferase
VSDEVRAGYDAWAPDYDALDNPLIAQATAVLEDHAALFETARVLELGCGTGRNLAFALLSGAREVVGVDGSPGMLAVAKKRLPRARFVEGPLTTPVGDGFDVALICLVLEHVEDVRPVIRAAADALAPGGHLLMMELHAALRAKQVGANFRVGDVEYRLPSFLHEGVELADACRAAGLREVEVRDHRPDPRALSRSPKLAARYAGQLILVEVVATK